MPKPSLPYVEKNPNRHGRMRYYFRRTRDDDRVRLPDAYLSPEFMASYQACLAGQPLALPDQGAVRKASRGSLGWLIKLYLQSSEFAAYKLATKRIRIPMLEKLAKDKGAIDLEDIDKGVIAEALKTRASTVAMANGWLSAVRNVFEWAKTEVVPGETMSILSENPCDFVKRLAKPKSDDFDQEDGHPTWSEDDLATFEAAYAHGTRERLVYELFLATGLRLGDAARLGRQHVRDGVIRIKTEKGKGTPVTIRITPRLQQALELGPKGKPEELAFITGVSGKAMEKTHLGKWFGQQCRAIGLDRSAHGLRKAAAVRYALQEATTKQLQARFGWTTTAMAEKYTAMADREKLSLGLDAVA